LTTAGEHLIKAGSCHIFQVPLPAEIRRPADEYDILVEVTLSFSANPRRTRRTLRRYLSTWADWKVNRIGESLEEFRKRVLKVDGNRSDEGDSAEWALGANPQHGRLRGVSRNASTVQKDWSIIKSNQLPSDFCIAVVGHKGWSSDPDSTARYTLAVSFELLGKEVPIFEQIQLSVAELRAQVETVVETQASIDIEADTTE
jgi:hypothetical protein